MSMPQSFRGAFNGFHREDVVNYISYISTKHETEVKELRAELEELRSQLAEREEELRSATQVERDACGLREQLEEQKLELGLMQEELSARDAQLETLRGELEQANEEKNLLEQKLEQQRQTISGLEKNLEEVRASAVPQPRKPDAAGRWTEELNAYRRAESAERRARERVNQMYDRANGALAEASVRVEQTAGHVAELVVKVESDLALLRQALTDSEETLADTAMVLGSIRPEMD